MRVPAWRMRELIDAEATSLATMPQTSLAGAHLLAIANVKDSNERRKLLLHTSQFVHSELAIRFAVRAKELERLPTWASKVDDFERVREVYAESFRRLRMLPHPTDAEGEAALTGLLRDIATRHTGVVPRLARGVQKLRHRGSLDTPERVQMMNSFLDRNLTARIGTTLLTSQHLALQEHREGFVGTVQLACNPASVVEQAVSDARFLCERKMGVAPAVHITGDTGLTFTYIPSYVHYIVGELLKNAMRATVMHHGADAEELPEIEVIVGGKNEDVGIVVRDRGGGIPRSKTETVFDYSYTTVDSIEDIAEVEAALDSGGGLLAGLGFGLPLSRLYARYFDGDLTLSSLEGYGTAAYCHLKSLSNVREAIPAAYTRAMRFRFDLTPSGDDSHRD